MGHFPWGFSEQTLMGAVATTNEHENDPGAQRGSLAKAWSKASRVAAEGHFPGLFSEQKALDTLHYWHQAGKNPAGTKSFPGK
jgi:hypothetical protein